MIRILRHIVVAAMISVSALAVVANESDTQEGITAVVRTEPKIITGSQCIEITINEEGNHEAAVYALTGQLVKHLSLTEGTTHIELKPGYYIVRIDGQSKRVVVK